MNVKSAMVAAIATACLVAAPAFAEHGTGSSSAYGAASHPFQTVPRSPQALSMPPLVLNSRLVQSGTLEKTADAFKAAYAAAPTAILTSHSAQASIVLSDVPVPACARPSRAAFALGKHGDILYGCEFPKGDDFVICWDGAGCRTYESRTWRMVSLSKTTPPAASNLQ